MNKSSDNPTGTKGRTDLDIEEDNDTAILHYIANAILNLDDAELFQLPNHIIRTNQNKQGRVFLLTTLLTVDCGQKGFSRTNSFYFHPAAAWCKQAAAE